MEIYVIAWSYYDYSSSDVMPYAYTDREEAERALAMLQEHGSRQYIMRTLKLLER